VPYFLDSEIPAAVFVGLHLLVTDPSTSPRTPIGKAIFGAMYGVGVLALYALLGALGAPTFYDKLLCVPLLNLSVKWIDRSAQTLEGGAFTARVRSAASWTGANAAHMSVWIVFFITMTALGKTEGRHTGDALPFWVQACAENRSTACRRLLLLESTYCTDRSAWACNELGVNYAEGKFVPADHDRALELFAQSCELRMQAGCDNLYQLGFDRGGSATRAPPRTLDLRLLLREGGKNLLEMSERDLYTRACEHGWTFACGSEVGRRL
jgi:TPR repeat protein